jgi:hypothetical protein
MLMLATLVGMLVSGAPTAAPEVNPYGKVFVGDGVTVEMAILEGKNAAGLNDVLLRITGSPAHDDGIDGKTLRYSASHGGTGVDFQYVEDGSTRNRMSTRNPWGQWKLIEVYLGSKTYKVYPDEAKSKASKPSQLLSEFRNPPK